MTGQHLEVFLPMWLGLELKVRVGMGVLA